MWSPLINISRYYSEDQNIEREVITRVIALLRKKSNRNKLVFSFLKCQNIVLKCSLSSCHFTDVIRAKNGRLVYQLKKLSSTTVHLHQSSSKAQAAWTLSNFTQRHKGVQKALKGQCLWLRMDTNALLLLMEILL